MISRPGGTAVLLLNMGGPDSIQAVRPFLKNLFSDPAIIGLPGFARLPLAAVLSSARAKKVIPRYRLIGGKSPIGEITSGQAEALAGMLSSRDRPEVGPVLPAFSYWHPFIRDSIEDASGSGCEELLVLSLYPQYCGATTGTCLRDLEAAIPGSPFEGRVRTIDRWPDHPGYLDALASTVREALAQIRPEERDDAVILFSAHGIPTSLADKGDPYPHEIARTVQGVVERLGNRVHVLAFQSRLGPVRWLAPNLREALKDLARKGAPPLVVVPVSFVSDHIETLYELDIQHREIAGNLGISTYIRAPALNTRTDFIEALADLAASALPPPGPFRTGRPGRGDSHARTYS